MKTPRERLVEQTEDPELIFCDGYDDCIVGVVRLFGHDPVVCYDLEKIITKLASDGMSREEAEEFFSFNIIGAYVGDRTPCFLEPTIPEEPIG